MAKRSDREKYTDPELRERIKEEINGSDKGGKKGQWRARKSQLLTQEYEKRGGGYKGEKDELQKNLEKWTDEEWQTQEGDARARGDGGETKRYLPKKAWENMSDEARDREQEARRFKTRRTIRRQHGAGETGSQRLAGSAAEELRRPECRGHSEEGKRALRKGDPAGPRLREAPQEPQDPHRVA